MASPIIGPRRRRLGGALGSTAPAIEGSANQTIPADGQRATGLVVETPGLIFRGAIGQVSINKRGLATFECRSLLTLGRGVASEVYGPICRADVFDTRCKLDKTLFQASATVLAIVDAFTFTVTALPDVRAVTGWYDLGEGVVASGPNSGLPFHMKIWTAGTLTIQTMTPIDQLLSGGETLTLYPGCNKLLATCRDKFNNVINRRAEDYAPGRDLAFAQN